MLEARRDGTMSQVVFGPVVAMDVTSEPGGLAPDVPMLVEGTRSNTTSTVDTDLRCPVCMSFFCAPVSLGGSCGHTFCFSCIRELKQMKCPTCKADIDKRDMSKNWAVVSLRDDILRNNSLEYNKFEASETRDYLAFDAYRAPVAHSPGATHDIRAYAPARRPPGANTSPHGTSPGESPLRPRALFQDSPAHGDRYENRH